MARKAQCSTLVVLSKWDQTTVEIEEFAPGSKPPAPAAAVRHDLGRDGSRHLARAREVAALYDKHTARIAHGRAQPVPRRAAR